MGQNYLLSETDLISRLVEALDSVPWGHSNPPNFQLKSGSRRGGIDAEISFELPGRSYRLLIEAKKSVYPRDVHQLLWQFDLLRKTHPGAVPVVAAQSISEGARQILMQEKIGFYDTGGSLFIPAEGAYIYIEKPPPKSQIRSSRNLFRGKKAQVLRTLLHESDRWFGVAELAELAQVSPATVSETLALIDRLEWTMIQGQGPSKERRLSQPSQLLDTWKKQLADAPFPPNLRRYFLSSAGTDEIVHRVAEACKTHHAEYALTGEVAAQIYAPHLSTTGRVTLRILWNAAANKAIASLGARVVREGANLNVIEMKSPGDFLFRQERGSVWLASPIDVYLDLQRSEGRGKDLADHLREERIGF